MKISNLVKQQIFSRSNFIFNIINLFVITVLFFLPYYLFEGRLFLGGDDTRLYYAYPSLLLKDLAIHPWINISSLPLYIPNHHAIPILAALSLVEYLLNSKIILFYLAFSLPMVFGFIYFQKLIREILGRKEYLISIVSALIYVLSPITLVSQISYFLNPVWLVALFPILSYYFLAFIKRGFRKDVTRAIIWSILLSIALYSSPWIFGLIISFFSGLLYILFTDKYLFKKIIKKSLIFWPLILAGQLFWVFPFVMSLLQVSDSYLAVKVASSGLAETFFPTVNSTATGNIFYPLMTFYHRQIALDFGWQLGNVFTSYYDYIFPASSVFFIVLYLGVTNYKRVFKNHNRKTFIFLFISFVIALYFFTVNIGFLKFVFLFLGYLPGFAVFRNFTDKFALSYIFVYALFLSTCFFVIKKSNKYYLYFITLILLVIFVNALPIKKIVNSPQWGTDEIYRNSNLSEEYLNFVKEIENKIPKTSNVFSIPQNSAAYSIIMETNGRNGYIGTSPFKFFTGINDLTGTGSYTGNFTQEIRTSIVSRNYENLLYLLKQINTGYLLVTKNIPKQIKESYMYDEEYLAQQDDALIHAIVEKEIIKSENGNFIFYKLKNSPSLFSPEEYISYTKISSVEYRLYIKDVRNIKELIFYETYNPGWKIYRSENSFSTVLAVLNELILGKKSTFNRSHEENKPYGNKWIVDYDELNKAGSEMTFTLYFFPQIYLYMGLIMTVFSLGVGCLYLYYKYEEKS